MWKCDVEADLKRRGLKIPSTYAKGYSHANCAGACILAGTKQWTGLLADDPEQFAFEEENEQRFLADLRAKGRKEITILRDRRGGVTRNLPLKQLREEVAQGIRHDDHSWRENSCSCMLF